MVDIKYFGRGSSLPNNIITNFLVFNNGNNPSTVLSQCFLIALKPYTSLSTIFSCFDEIATENNSEWAFEC